MSAEPYKQDSLRIAAGIVCAILAFQIVSLIFWIPFQSMRASPNAIARGVYAVSLIVIPSSAIAVAVLTARWVERRLVSVQRKACVVLLVVVSMAALLSCVRIRTEFTPVKATPAMLRQMDSGESAETGAAR